MLNLIFSSPFFSSDESFEFQKIAVQHITLVTNIDAATTILD